MLKKKKRKEKKRKFTLKKNLTNKILCHIAKIKVLFVRLLTKCCLNTTTYTLSLEISVIEIGRFKKKAFRHFDHII